MIREPEDLLDGTSSKVVSMSVCVSWPIGQIRRFVNIFNFLPGSKRRSGHRALCALVLAVLLSTVIQTDRVIAQPAEASISVTIPGSLVDSHPYGLVSDPNSSLGYCAIAGDVTPFGEAVPDYANFVVAELDLHTLEVIRTFEVGYYPTEMQLLGQGLYVTCSNDSNLYRIDLPSGVVDSFPMTDSTGNSVGFLSGLNVDSSGNVVVGSNGGNFDGSDENILVFDPVGEAITQRIEVAGSITRFMVRNGELVVPLGYPDNDFTAAPRVVWIDLVSGSVVGSLNFDVDTADFPGPSDIEDLGDGSAVVSVYGGSSEVFHIDLDQKSLIQTLPMGGGDLTQAALQSLGGGVFLVSDLLAGWIRKVDSLTGEISDFGSGLSLPVDMVLKSGRLFVSEQGIESVSVFSIPGSFIRGDSNMDRTIDVSDPVTLLEYLFVGGDLSCQDAGDVNDDGLLDIADAVNVLEYLFSDGVAPGFPFPVGGADLEPDSLDCAHSS
ncbi:MAG: hypothetical protein ACJ0DK_03235 [Planctomycetota bacterium]